MPMAVSAPVPEIITAIANPCHRRDVVAVEENVRAAKIRPELVQFQCVFNSRCIFREAERQREHGNADLAVVKRGAHGVVNFLDVVVLNGEASDRAALAVNQDARAAPAVDDIEPVRKVDVHCAMPARIDDQVLGGDVIQPFRRLPVAFEHFGPQPT